ncbi:hypothetical protein Esi_0188_0014 [Ectocarpus siliculosus]|uniref:Uncharacterized protein n=1 Tax=Ectocarpus siliculosus TaxID=2880 RepID=D7FPB3_ECTSI|nr:hypothetical protein Esi_0188_0014 [Ectocarpus siliculosus]|eukprot:CBJ30372.1 hypothetical protein Esi_0188_0014 [Ectocarpus siliculosus]
MPARKVTEAATKRKSPGGHPPSPRSKAKKRLIQGDSNHAAAAPDCASSKPAVSRAHKFIVGLAVQLTSTCDDEEVDVDVQVEGLFRAALGALPAGKLKAELVQDEAATMKTLAAEVASIRSKQQQSQNGGEVATGKDAGVAAACALVPCTAQLYRQARAIAEKQSRGIDGAATDNKPLRALALSPRAPLDLLANAMGSTSKLDGAAAPVSTTLDAAVISLRDLVGALAADPLAAMSPSGLAFFADRAAVLASSAARSLVAGRGDTRGGDSVTGDKAALEVEALGLMLRILQVAGLALSAAAGGNTASGLLRATDDAGSGGCRPADPASWLLLPCAPETPSAWNGEVSATSLDSSLGTLPRNEVDSTPPARISVARLLAHYAASVAACSVGRKAVVKAAQAAATAGGREVSDDESSSDSDEEEETGDGPDSNKSNNIALSRHLSALCAANLAGSEPGTLEFLRCVGDAVFATDDVGNVSLAAPLAPACGRALARLRRPAATPAPTAAQFLRRAYAFRVTETLNRSARAASLSSSKPPSRKEAIAPTAIAGRGSSGCARSGSGGGAAAAAAAAWDFVGDSSAPPALLEFLGRPEAPAAVGQGDAAQPALKELASRRNSPAAVAELLRSSPACAPAALGPLLSAMERLQGVGEGGGNTAAAAAAVGVGGFFVDTGGAAGGARSVVLARLGNGAGIVADMDEEEVASVASSAVSDSDGNE